MKSIFKTFLIIWAVILITVSVKAQIPSGYYNGTSGLSGDSLKTVLHNIIKNHTTLSYSAVKEALKVTDQDTIDTTKVVCLYTGWTYAKTEFGNGSEQWNREHVWSKSHGDFGDTPPAGTDLHHLRPCDASVNSAKGNRDFDYGVTQYIDGSGPTQCYTDTDIWEPRDEVKGDVARMIFYMAVRYEGDSGEPDLELVDYVNSAPNHDSLYGKLSTLLQWNNSDPVDDWERRRNDSIYYRYQNNRNPFIDHPEFADLIWNDTVKPEPSNHVSNFQVSNTTTHTLTVTWDDNDGSVAAESFLIMINTSGSFTAPVDSVPQADDTDVSDGSGRVNVLHGTETYTWNQLDSATIYYLTIYPYNNTGNNINYKTDGTVPTAYDTTNSNDTTVFSVYNLIISEVADPSDNYEARYVELYNAGTQSIDFDTSTWYLCRQANGGSSSWGDIELTGTIQAGDTYTIAYSSSGFNSAYGFDPDKTSGYISGNGDDGYFLYHNGNHETGTLIDAYGVIDQDGSGEAWEYLDKKAVRIFSDTAASDTWNENDWVIYPTTPTQGMTPDWHHKTIEWTGATSSEWDNAANWQYNGSSSPYAPDAGSNNVITSQGNSPEINSNTICGKIVIQSGAVINITNNATLTVKSK